MSSIPAPRTERLGDESRLTLLAEEGVDGDPLVTVLLSADGGVIDGSVELHLAAAEAFFRAGLRMVKSARRADPSRVR